MEISILLDTSHRFKFILNIQVLQNNRLRNKSFHLFDMFFLAFPQFEVEPPHLSKVGCVRNKLMLMQ